MAISLSACSKVIDDAMLTTHVTAALMADPKINSYDFKVESHKGEVQLSGYVDNQAQLDLAIDTVRSLEGVKSIQNHVALKSASASLGNKVDDGISTARVKAALLADPSMQSLDIHVVTRLDQVQLSGFVNNQLQMDRAMQVATAVEGVGHVSNQMQLKK